MLTNKQICLGAVSPWLRKVMLTLSSMTSLSVTQKLMNLNITNAKFSENNLVSLLQIESTNLMEVTAIFNGRVSFYTFKCMIQLPSCPPQSGRLLQSQCKKMLNTEGSLSQKEDWITARLLLSRKKKLVLWKKKTNTLVKMKFRL